LYGLFRAKKINEKNFRLVPGSDEGGASVLASREGKSAIQNASQPPEFAQKSLGITRVNSPQLGLTRLNSHKKNIFFAGLLDWGTGALALRKMVAICFPSIT
jgi:hypothetical protein